MRAYVFQAALLCEHCAQEYMRNTDKPESADDSNAWPQGPYAYGGGEADCPQHCDHCAAFLENPLTDEGGQYVREAAAPFDREGASWAEIAAIADAEGSPAVADWIRFYLADGQ